MSSEMYAEIVLDYYRNPREFGEVTNANAFAQDVNPSCGDKIKFTAKIKDNKVEEIKFSGEGCAISIAASSMLAEQMKGKTVDKIKNLKKEDILEMLNIPVSPMRLKCALLGMKVLKVATYQYLGEKIED